MSKVKVAAIQMRSGMTPERNADSFETLVREAASAGAQYIQSPEMTGALVRDRASLEPLIRSEDQDLLFARAQGLARELGIFLHLGSTPIALEGGAVANRGFMFGDDGQMLARYDKIHMFDVDLDNGESWRESNSYEPGTMAPVVRTPFADIAMAICYDLRFPHLFRQQALAGAHILTVPAAFTRQTGQAHWHVLLRARAIENGSFVIAAAQGGKHEDGRETFGHSLIVDPWGKVLAEADHDEPGVVMAELDIGVVESARSKVPNLKNDRRFDVDVIARSVAVGAAS